LKKIFWAITFFILSVFIGYCADGYASLNKGTTGGAKGEEVTVSNRAELVKALHGNTPRIIYIKGTIDLCVDEKNNPLKEEDFIAESAGVKYSLAAYLDAYAPSKWNNGGNGLGKNYGKEPSGALEAARKSSQIRQSNVVVITSGSNKSVIGLASDAKIIHGTFLLDNVSNIIIKNITFEDAYDYFPQWDPTDGALGNWNSQYDLISIQNGAKNIWIDHCSFSDGERADSTFPNYFGREYQHHDGAIDITKQASFITVSYCYFTNHDKTCLFGSSDNPQNPDKRFLKVTMHHNFFDKTGQRTPRVRFGEVHVYNNYYNDVLEYAIGVGVSSSIYAEANFFEGKAVEAQLSFYDKQKTPGAVKDIKNLPPLNFKKKNSWTLTEVNWDPAKLYSYKADPANEVKKIVSEYAGAGKTERQ
jgi:pectate lyase